MCVFAKYKHVIHVCIKCAPILSSDELCYRMFVETDHSHNLIIPPLCPVPQHYTRDGAHS